MSVSWQEPATSGAFPVSTYQVVSQPAGGTCLASAPALTCEVDGLEPGRAYTFSVRALNGSGWGLYSERSNSVTIPRQRDPAIVITGSRSGRLVVVEGRAQGLSTGSELLAWVRIGQDESFAQGRIVAIGPDGKVAWQRRASRAVQVYLTSADASVRSNTVRVAAR